MREQKRKIESDFAKALSASKNSALSLDGERKMVKIAAGCIKWAFSSLFICVLKGKNLRKEKGNKKIRKEREKERGKERKKESKKERWKDR